MPDNDWTPEEIAAAREWTQSYMAGKVAWKWIARLGALTLWIAGVAGGFAAVMQYQKGH